MENAGKRGDNAISLLDLPESAMDPILQRLSPIELIKLSEVCSGLRDACRSDHLWKNHLKQKWGSLIGDVAFKEWQWHIKIAKADETLLNQHLNQNGSLGSFCGNWPGLCIGSYLEDFMDLKGFLSKNCMMALYLSLESGKFWFPAQIYREMRVSNALFSYDSRTETFRARQPNGGGCTLWQNIPWERLRASTVETPPCVCHVSDCLEDLKPGNCIEIQRKPRGDYHYDWFFAVIGDLDSCNGNEEYCRCGNSETLVVEFIQYPRGMSMRRLELSRHRHREQVGGNIGVYGGIRKIQSQEVFQKWMEHFPLYRIFI